MFDIRFQPAEDVDPTEMAIGVIVLGPFREVFESPLHVWGREQYHAHWVEAVERLLSGSGVAALITEMYDPAVANFIKWWPAYRFGASVRFHSQLLLMTDLQTPFDLEDPFVHLPPYQRINEDGDLLSEWSVPTDDLVLFLEEHKDLEGGG